MRLATNKNTRQNKLKFQFNTTKIIYYTQKLMSILKRKHNNKINTASKEPKPYTLRCGQYIVIIESIIF